MRYARCAMFFFILASTLAAPVAGGIYAQTGAGAAEPLYCRSGDTLFPLTNEECELGGLDPAKYETMKPAFEELCKSTYGNEYRVLKAGDLRGNKTEGAAPATAAQ